MFSLGLASAGNHIGSGMQEIANVLAAKSFQTGIEQTPTEEDAEFMALPEVRSYLRTDADIEAMVAKGELAGTYVKIGDTYVFSREKLRQWFMAKAEE